MRRGPCAVAPCHLSLATLSRTHSAHTLPLCRLVSGLLALLTRTPCPSALIAVGARSRAHSCGIANTRTIKSAKHTQQPRLASPRFASPSFGVHALHTTCTCTCTTTCACTCDLRSTVDRHSMVFMRMAPQRARHQPQPTIGIAAGSRSGSFTRPGGRIPWPSTAQRWPRRRNPCSRRLWASSRARRWTDRCAWTCA
jgi:hypothetical protein